MNERRKQGILLLFPVVVLLLGIIFTTTLFYHTYRQIAYQHISAFCEILLENSPEAEPQLLKLSNRNLDQTILLITHDEKIALEADRIITIEDGKIVSDQKRR